MPFPILLPFFPGNQPNVIFSREEQFDDYDDYLALADQTTTVGVFDSLPTAPSGPILDAGCGGGRWLVRLSRRGRAAVGLDLHRPVLDRLHGFEPRIPLFAGSVEALPFRTGSIAAVISLGVVEHIEAGPGAALAEFARVLRPGGRLLLSVPYDNWLRRLIFDHLFRWYHNRHAGKNRFFVEYRFRRREILAAIEATGLRPLAEHPHDYLAPLNMGLVSDLSILGTRFKRRGDRIQLQLGGLGTWRLQGWWAWCATLLQRVSPWIAAAEILVVAEKPPNPA